MKRREFITLLGGAARAWPFSAGAQQPTMSVVGFLSSTSMQGDAPYVAAFRQGLQQAGYREGQNVAIEYRWAKGQNDRLPTMAADLVRRQVTVIAVLGPPAALAAKAATSTIPIVFVTGRDPVELGLVESLARPGGNATGVVTLSGELGLKRLELLHEAVPTATIMALLINPTYPNVGMLASNLEAQARILGLQLHVLHASTEQEIDHVFVTLVQLQAGALVIATDPFFLTRSEQFAALALRHSVPTIFQYRTFTTAGGLMSYGTNIEDMDRQAGIYVGRILKGEKPADLPVQQATKVELTINLKTAKSLGLDLPASVLVRADEVIE
jgi:putative ABC transport system substrate-binding protein